MVKKILVFTGVQVEIRKSSIFGINCECYNSKKQLGEYNPWKSYGEHLCYDVKYIHHKKLEYDGGEELGAKNGGEVYTCARRLGVGWANTPQCRDLATYLMIDRGWTL